MSISVGPRSPSARARTTANAITGTSKAALMPTVAVPQATKLVPSPLLPDGFKVPASRFVHPSTRMRELLETEPFLFGPGVYDPMGAQLVMYHGYKTVYFSGYSFAIGHLGTTSMHPYSSSDISDAAHPTL